MYSYSDRKLVFTPIFTVIAPYNAKRSSTNMRRYDIPEPIGSKTLTTTIKLGVILLNRASNDFGASHYGRKTITMAFNHF